MPRVKSAIGTRSGAGNVVSLFLKNGPPEGGPAREELAMPDDPDNSPGFLRAEFPCEGAERLVLRFPEADASILPTASNDEGKTIRLELELRGPKELVASWRPELRRVEGILVVAEGQGPVHVTELKASVPAAIHDIELHTKTGDVEVRGLSIGVRAETESGSVRVEGASSLEARSLSGDIDAERIGSADIGAGSGRVRCVLPFDRVVVRSKSGDIDIEDAKGDLVLETASGEISVARPRGRVRAASQAGDIEIEALGPFGGGEATSVSGRIGFNLAGADLELRAETLSGRLRTPQGEIGSPAGPRRCALSVGKGGRRLHAKSVSGDIEIEF